MILEIMKGIGVIIQGTIRLEQRRKHLQKIGEQQIPCIALIDHGLEIDMMSSEFYARGQWPIDKIHGWKIRLSQRLQNIYSEHALV